MNKKVRDKPDLLVFDLDNTLYEYEPCNRAGEESFINYASEILGIPRVMARRNLATARKNVKLRLSGASSHERSVYFAEFLVLCNALIDPRFILEADSLYWSSYLTKMELAPFSREVLTKARLNQMSVALVTNLTSIIQYRKLVHLGIENMFDVVITSQETTGEKDTLEPFSLLSSRLRDREIKSAWFFGDTDSDFPDSYSVCNKKFFGSPFAQKSMLRKDVVRLQSYKKIVKLLD